jgi:glycosyltransferase involved in cell wall biosynthesis
VNPEKAMLVSVIIPTYNRGRTIARAIDSILAQTWKSIEIIVVDSQSTDETAKVLASYGNKIHVIQQPRNGPPAARNAGIKLAKGEIIAFLDSDDEWLPEKLERQVKLLKATESAGVKCCVCNARMEFISGTLTSFASADLYPKQSEGIWINPTEVLCTRFLFFNQVVAVRREALEQVGCFRSGMMEDYDLALRLSLIGPWAFIADTLVVWHDQIEDSLTRKTNELERCERAFEIIQNISSASDLGPLLPKALTRRRLRNLSKKIKALHLSNRSNAFANLAGKVLLFYLRHCDALYWRLASPPQMATRAV